METTLAIIAIVISLLTAGGSLAYTHQQMKEARRSNQLTEQAQREQAQPYVIADIRERVPGSMLLCFFIENTGPTVARDVQISVDPPLESALGSEQTEKLRQAVTRKIPMMPPGRSLMFMMDAGSKLFNSDLPRIYSVVINSSGPFGPLEPLTYTIDLNVLQHMLLNRESLEWSTHVLAEEAKKSRKLQEKQVDAVGRFLRMADEELEGRRELRNSMPPEIEP
ncbi:hypothetical protein AB0H94_06970 [Streptomyces purpurascens]|uniref:hypothetical protein n=1 Tax=Streptomyces purpurascens TaxID=1924 RepID=UPI0033CB96C7